MKPRLFVIDDDIAVIDILRLKFELEGFEVVSCNMSTEALKEALIELPDVITLDILMPVRSGWEVLEELKGNPCTKDTPIIICSVAQKPEEKDRATRMGAAAYVPKPFDLLELVNLVKELSGWRG